MQAISRGARVGFATCSPRPPRLPQPPPAPAAERCAPLSAAERCWQHVMAGGVDPSPMPVVWGGSTLPTQRCSPPGGAPLLVLVWVESLVQQQERACNIDSPPKQDGDRAKAKKATNRGGARRHATQAADRARSDTCV